VGENYVITNNKNEKQKKLKISSKKPKKVENDTGFYRPYQKGCLPFVSPKYCSNGCYFNGISHCSSCSVRLRKELKEAKQKEESGEGKMGNF
jgi:hypothetical protein